MKPESTKARNPETKIEARIRVAAGVKKLLQAAIEAGFAFWKPGQVIQMSDRSYLVRKDGSWKRLRPGMIIETGPLRYEVSQTGTLNFIGKKAA